jgi:hypothetical protein
MGATMMGVPGAIPTGRAGVHRSAPCSGASTFTALDAVDIAYLG